jgi:type II restriction/modification system DNA methylase subunit YeeA
MIILILNILYDECYNKINNTLSNDNKYIKNIKQYGVIDNIIVMVDKYH